MSRSVACMLAVVICLGTFAGWGHAQEVESGIEAKWYACVGLGVAGYEGDEELQDGFITTFRIGYDHTEWWSWEGVLLLAPDLNENTRVDLATGETVSRLEEAAGAGVHSTYGVGLAIDGLYHFTRWDRLDPYLTVGGGFMWYADDMGDGQADPVVRVGGGVMYHFNDEWAVRADGRTFVAGKDTEANAVFDAGLVWTWGARVAPRLVAIEGPLDSDGDGLTDIREGELGTDPYDPDTDDDGLSDGEEVLTYLTDPLNPDSDWDALQDGEEVKRYETNPLKRDTDNGGVADGHEVIEDSTNPLDGSDDLVLFELYLQFDWDKAIIKTEFFQDLDIIAKVLKRNPDATARVEGHADRNRKSKAGYNKRLSERRARAVVSYLSEIGGVAADRMEALGYGYDRPKAANDPESGNPVNRRVEVYIRGADKAQLAEDLSAVGAGQALPEDK